MCIICLQFQKDRDLADARQMLAKARSEPKSIDPEHLREVERVLDEAERQQSAESSDND